MTCVPIRLVLIAEHWFMYFLYYIKILCGHCYVQVPAELNVFWGS